MSADACARCGSRAINLHLHGRGHTDTDLCDVCYWRRRAPAATDLVLKFDSDFLVDWKDLRDAKQAVLVTIEFMHGGQQLTVTPEFQEKARGLLHFLDAFQDAAEKVLGQELVFGIGGAQ